MQDKMKKSIGITVLLFVGFRTIVFGQRGNMSGFDCRRNGGTT